MRTPCQDVLAMTTIVNIVLVMRLNMVAIFRQKQSDSDTAVKCRNGERVCSATTNQNSVKHERSASSQDSDPVLYLGPLCRDDHFSGSKALPLV